MFHNLLALLNVVLPPSIALFLQMLHLSISPSHSLMVLYKPLEAYIWDLTWMGCFFWLVIGCWFNAIPFCLLHMQDHAPS
jgi:hypothetical protein